MSDWLHNLPVGWMAAVFFGCAYLSAAVIYAVVVEFPTALWVRARAFSASMLSPMGTLFAFSSCSLQRRSGMTMIEPPLRLLRRRARSEAFWFFPLPSRET